MYGSTAHGLSPCVGHSSQSSPHAVCGACGGAKQRAPIPFDFACCKFLNGTNTHNLSCFLSQDAFQGSTPPGKTAGRPTGHCTATVLRHRFDCKSSYIKSI